MPSQIAEPAPKPLEIEHIVESTDPEYPSEVVRFSDLDGDALVVIADRHGAFFQTTCGAGAQFSPADATTVAATILKLVAPPAGELALPLLAGTHVAAAYPIGRAMIQTLALGDKPSEESIFVALVALAITQARAMGAKTPAEAIAMITTVPGLPGVKYNLNDKFTDL